MTRIQIWLHHLSNLLVTATGVAYFVMKHLMTSDDPFAVVNHPAQPLAQHLHVLAAPMLVFFTGVSWALHAAPNARSVGAPSWRSGILLMTGFAPMMASGYLLQVSVEPGWRSAWLWAHLATSALWVLACATHLARPVLAAIRTWRGDGLVDQARTRPPAAEVDALPPP